MRSTTLISIILVVLLTVRTAATGLRSVNQQGLESDAVRQQQLTTAAAVATTEGAVSRSRRLRSATTAAAAAAAAAATEAQLVQQLQQQQQCATGTRRCGSSSTCLSLTDPAACGPACTRCPKPAANGVATCSQQGVCGVSCAKGYEPAAAAGKAAAECRLCGANTFKAVAGPDPCSRCPAGTFTSGDSAADRDEEQDCRILPSLACGPGTQLQGASCTVCPANTFKAGTNADRCQACPEGSRTFGSKPADHDGPDACLSGGLITSAGNTGASAEALLDFDDQLDWARNNTGAKKNPPRPPKKHGRPKKACLYACGAASDADTDEFSAKVAYIAGSPWVYYMNDPRHVRSGVNLVSAVRNQRSCGTCVSQSLASAAESAAAVAMRVDALGFNISHTFSYFCAEAFTGGKSATRSCGTGWEFKPALDAMEAAPAAFVMNSSCLGGVDPAVAQLLPDAKLKAFCTSDLSAACSTAWFTCSHKALSDGVFQLQQHIRLYGSVVTGISITNSLTSFFRSNPTGVFNGTAGANATADQPDDSPLPHAVQLIGYNNEEMFWLAKNSYGTDWGDKGLFRIAYGAAGVGHPEDTFALVDCFTTSNNSATVAAWSDRWPVIADKLPGCVLYNATARDTISGIVDHFQVEILPFVRDNTERLVIPTLMLGEPPRPEPQLRPNTSWAGTVFRVCGIPSKVYERVATDPCTADAKHCNGRQTRCDAGRCVCPERYAGQFCEIDKGVQRNFSLPGGQAYVLHLEPQLNWTDAQKRCDRDGMRLARLYSRQHAIEVYRQVKQQANNEFWIGLNDRRREGAFAWVGGSNSSSETPLDFQGLWFPGGPQPDNYEGIEHCVQVWTPQVLPDRQVFDAWNDGQCLWPSAFLCGPAEESADPCVRFPCNSGGTRPAVGCKAAIGSNSSKGAKGRVCLCDAGLSYVNDELGCAKPPVFDVFEFQLNGVAHELFLSPQASWTQADSFCKDRGMNLVKITGEEYAMQLHEIVKAKFVERGVSTRYWIGLNDRAAEGRFVWSSDDTSLAQGGYQRWAKNEPTNSCPECVMPEGEDCVWVYFSGLWNDGACQTQTYFVCSKV